MRWIKIISAAFVALLVGSIIAFLRTSSPPPEPGCSTLQHDCGPASLYLISKAAGVPTSFAALKQQTQLTGLGTSLLGIREAARRTGWRATGLRVHWAELQAELGRGNTYAVLHFTTPPHFVAALGAGPHSVLVADPRGGSRYCAESELQQQGWQGHVLFLTR